MKRATDSISSGDVSKSGKPCDRLIAPTSLARRVMTAKMLTPPAGNFEGTARTWDIVPNDSLLGTRDSDSGLGRAIEKLRVGRWELDVGSSSSHCSGFSETSGYCRRSATTRSK